MPRILVRRSKTDQGAADKRKPLPFGSNPATCPVRILVAWLSAAEITQGPIVRSVNSLHQLQPQAVRRLLNVGVRRGGTGLVE